MGGPAAGWVVTQAVGCAAIALLCACTAFQLWVERLRGTAHSTSRVGWRVRRVLAVSEVFLLVRCVDPWAANGVYPTSLSLFLSQLSASAIILELAVVIDRVLLAAESSLENWTPMRLLRESMCAVVTLLFVAAVVSAFLAAEPGTDARHSSLPFEMVFAVVVITLTVLLWVYGRRVLRGMAHVVAEESRDARRASTVSAAARKLRRLMKVTAVGAPVMAVLFVYNNVSLLVGSRSRRKGWDAASFSFASAVVYFADIFGHSLALWYVWEPRPCAGTAPAGLAARRSSFPGAQGDAAFGSQRSRAPPGAPALLPSGQDASSGLSFGAHAAAAAAGSPPSGRRAVS